MELHCRFTCFEMLENEHLPTYFAARTEWYWIAATGGKCSINLGMKHIKEELQSVNEE